MDAGRRNLTEYDNLRLTEVFIASSHNTYINGNQITGKPSTELYERFILEMGGGCVEIDPVLDPDGVIRVYHGAMMKKSWKSSLPTMEDVLNTIIETMRKLGDNGGFVIISFDNKSIKTYDGHVMVWNVLKRTLYKKENEDIVRHYANALDPEKTRLDQIKGKIITRWDHCLDSDFINDKCKHKGLGRPPGENNILTWVNITKPKYDDQGNIIESSQTTMRTENTGVMYFKEDKDIYAMRNHTKNILFRVYPDPATNMESTNDNPIDLFRAGIQLIAMNIQSPKAYARMVSDFFKKFAAPTYHHYVVRKPEKYIIYNIRSMNFTVSGFNPGIIQTRTRVKILNKKMLNHGGYIKISDTKLLTTAVYSVFPLIYLSTEIDGVYFKGSLPLLNANNYHRPPDTYRPPHPVEVILRNKNGDEIPLYATFEIERTADDGLSEGNEMTANVEKLMQGEKPRTIERFIAAANREMEKKGRQATTAMYDIPQVQRAQRVSSMLPSPNMMQRINMFTQQHGGRHYKLTK